MTPLPPSGFGSKPSPAALGDIGLAMLTQVPAKGAAVAGTFTTGIMALRDAIMGGDLRPAVAAVFVDSLQRLRDIPDGWDVADALARALATGYVLPHTAMRPALLVLQTDPAFAQACALAERGDAAGIARLLDNGLLAALAHPLLLTLMRATVLTGPDLEFILTIVRRRFLSDALRGDGPPPALAEALAAQCFLNEYAFYCDEAEARDVAALATAADVPASPFAVAVLGSYAPLASYPWVDRLPEGPLVTQQVREPAAERALAAAMDSLKPIADPTSRMVQALYEENPYPRWAMPYRTQAREAREVYRQRYPGADFRHLDTVAAPEILVAGCGTGANLLLTVAGYRDWRIVAVDLSRASLAYARRHLDALGLANIRLLQADILDLGLLPGTFDIIEAAGVLHHMADPAQGWRVLAGKLRPGGVMHVALYSAVARRGIDTLRAFAKARGYAATRDGIAHFRHDVLTILRTPGHPDRSTMEEIGIGSMYDFFSTSACRDLVFHPQEATFTIPGLERMIAGLGLVFRGFSFPSPAFLGAYRQRFPDDPHGLNLANWHRFEQENPSLFIRMYTFTVQKPLK